MRTRKMRRSMTSARVGRAAILAALVLALVVVSFASPAAAQSIPELLGACGPVVVTATPNVMVIDPEGRAFVNVKLENQGQLGTRAEVTATLTSGTGWLLSTTTDSRALDSDEVTFQFVIAAAPEVSEFGTVEFAGKVYCQGDGAQAVAANSPKVSISLERGGADSGLGSFGEAVTRALGDRNVLLAGGTLLFAGVVALALIARRKPKGGVTVRAEEVEKRVRPGRGISFPVIVENRGSADEQVTFAVGDVPVGWTAFMAVPELTLAGSESRTVWLMVRAPQGTADGVRADISVDVRAGDSDARTRTIKVTAIVAENAHVEN